MKKGYQIQYMDTVLTSERSVTLSKLIKTTNKKEIVAYIITYKKGNAPSDYLCIPHPNSSDSIKKLYWQSLYDGENNSSYKLQIISFILSKSLLW